jgi:quinohemoprotein ethanol dehydrogenase
MSYDPQTRLTYIPAMEWPQVYVDTSHRRVGMIEGAFTAMSFSPEGYNPKALASLYGVLPPLEVLDRGLPPARSRGYLRAWDPVHQRLAWEVATATRWDGGVLSTAGGLVFQGDATGHLNVYKADDGTRLTSIMLGTGVMAAPATYRVNGTQYVVVMAGYGGLAASFRFTHEMAGYRYDNEGRILALQLDGPAVPLPPQLADEPIPAPPRHEGSPAQIAEGEVLYNRFCSRCHIDDRGVLPDLRRMTPEKHQIFYDIVMHGLLASAGMGRWDDVLSRADAEAIHAYIVDEAWMAYRAAPRDAR